MILCQIPTVAPCSIYLPVLLSTCATLSIRTSGWMPVCRRNDVRHWQEVEGGATTTKDIMRCDGVGKKLEAATLILLGLFQCFWLI
jgi:hypothetical protein